MPVPPSDSISLPEIYHPSAAEVRIGMIAANPCASSGITEGVSVPSRLPAIPAGKAISDFI